MGKNINLGNLVEQGIDFFQKISNDHTRDLQRWKKGLGTSFKPNLFLVKFSIPNSLEKNNSGFYSNEIEPYLVKQNAKYFQQGKSILNQTKDLINKSGGVRDFLTKDNLKSLIKTRGLGIQKSVDWYALCTRFTLPGLELTMTPEVSKNRKYINGITRNNIVADFINDQWSNNYTFWENYVTGITNGRNFNYYPDEYMFDIEVYVYSTQMKTFKTYVFKECSPIRLGELILDQTAGREVPIFTVDINWNDYEVEVKDPLILSLPIIGDLYGEEAKNIMINKVKDTFSNASQSNFLQRFRK